MKFTHWERGPRAVKEQKLRDTLRESYGILIDRRTPGCLKPEFNRTYDHAYNEVMSRIIRRYGKDVVRELAEQTMGDKAL